jgi:N-acyl amino acid synthase of PEP-CTERM/exosortase system
MNEVVAAFNEYFEIVNVETPELLREVFRLRYQVLCIEQRAPGFDASRYSDEMESDEHDRHSSHILLRHRPSNQYVGTARLILPDPLDPNWRFPTEQHTVIDPAVIDTSTLPRQNMGEISRLVVIRLFNRRRDEILHAIEHENGTDAKDWIVKKQRRFPHPMLALAVGIIHMSVAHNVTHWLSSMEPALNRLLGLYGLQLDAIGPLAEHYGLRRPYYVNLVNMLARMHQNHTQYWELVTDHGKVSPSASHHAHDPASGTNTYRCL